MLAAALVLAPATASATWSIVAIDPQTREVGAAGASCVDGVERIAGLAPGKGVVASQAASNLVARDRAVELLEAGLTPEAILTDITSAAFDTNSRRRQYGLAAFNGPPAGFTGAGTMPWAGHAEAANVSVQGNILVSEQVVADALAAFAQPSGCSVRLSDRLMAALEAGGRQGGDSRCPFAKAAISAFVMVAGPDDREPSLHLEALAPDRDPDNPVTDLRAQYDQWRASQPARSCPDAAAPRPDARPGADARPGLDAGAVPQEVPQTHRVTGACAVGGSGGRGWALLLGAWLLGRRRRISCARPRWGATLEGTMCWGRLAATVAVLALGCSLRSLDDLSNGSPPPDAEASLDTATGGQGGQGAEGGQAGADAAPPSSDSATASGQWLFWVDSGDRSVHSATIDGSGAKKLTTLPAPSYLRSISVDTTHRKIYFSDSGLKKIQRVNFDGTAPEDVLAGLDVPVGLDLDVPGGKIYFADQGVKPTIFRANLDGTAKEAIVAAGIVHPYGLALDRGGGRVYFVDNGADGVFRANLDGTGLEKLPIAGVTDPIELAIDPQGGKLYWSDIGMPPRIRRANLDGSAPEDVITQARSATLSTPLGVVVDVLARKLYWVDGGTGTLDVIQRAELDGSAVHPVVVGLSAPRGLTIGY